MLCCKIMACRCTTVLWLESWDELGYDDKYKPTAKFDADLKVWFEAKEAANNAHNGGGPTVGRYGHLGALPPSKVRFQMAHQRWRARRGELAVDPRNQARAFWLDRFAAQLGKLQPTISPTFAWQHAEATFAGAAELTPEDAAEIFVLEEPPPGDLGAPE